MQENNTTEIKFKDKIYGRENELDVLNNAFAKAFDNVNQLVLIKGLSGNGKSSLVRTFAQNLDQKQVRFLTGKQDLSRNNPPYDTLIQAFNKLIVSWKSEGEDFHKKVKNVLERELGNQIHFILDIFPNLREIIKREVIKEIKPRMAFKDRFNEAFLNFINALPFFNQKFVVFLDDLQWADAATISFIELYISEGKRNNILWIGAYRDNELDKEDWLIDSGLDAEIDERNLTIIQLSELGLDTITKMYHDAIKMSDERSKLFGKLILQITGGNPLYVKESLRFMKQDGILFQDTENGTWDFDISKIQKAQGTDRVIDFVIRKMESLNEEVLELIAIGAAIGNRFKIGVLSAVSKRTPEEIIGLLKPGIENRIIEFSFKENVSASMTEFRFLHDKMQDAAYSMVPEKKRRKFHFSIGQTYSSSLGYAAQDRNIFDIVNQFNRCQSHFNTSNERFELLEMNIKAGKKAKSSGSFGQANKYFNIAIEIIERSANDWGKEIYYELYLEAGETAYLRSDFVSSVMFFESALKYTSTNLQEAKVYHNFLVMYNSVSDMEAAWKSGLKVLQVLGVSFPKRIGKGKVLGQLLKINLLLRKYPADKLLEREDLNDKRAEQTLLTLMEMIASAWDQKPEILGYLVLKGFEITLKKGNSPTGYFGIGGYGVLLGLTFGKREEGWSFVKLGGEITEKYDSMIFHGRGNFAVYGTYSHLIIHAKNNIEPLRDAYTFSKGAGDYNIASYSNMILVENLRAVGVSLAEIVDESNVYYSFAQRTSNADYIVVHKGILATCNLLIKGYKSVENEILEIEKRIENVNFRHIRYTWKIDYLKALAILGESEKAKVICDSVLNEGYTGLSAIEIERSIFGSIVITDSVLRGNLNKRRGIKLLKKELKEAKTILKTSEDNYGQIAELIQALLAEINEDDDKIVTHYKGAIELSDKYGFIQNQAVFSERLGRFYLNKNQTTNAIDLITESKLHYAKWGAKHKVNLLAEELESLR